MISKLKDADFEIADLVGICNYYFVTDHRSAAWYLSALNPVRLQVLVGSFIT